MANVMDLNQLEGCNSCITVTILTKPDVHQRVIGIYMYFKFHENMFSSYLVMANFMGFKSIQGL